MLGDGRGSGGESCGVLIGASVIGFIAGMFVGTFTIAPTYIRTEQGKAIEAGVGRWEVDAATGATKFTYGTK